VIGAPSVGEELCLPPGLQELTLSLFKPPPVPTSSGEDAPNTGKQDEGVIKGIPRIILVVRVP